MTIMTRISTIVLLKVGIIRQRFIRHEPESADVVFVLMNVELKGTLKVCIDDLKLNKNCVYRLDLLGIINSLIGIYPVTTDEI